MKKVLKKRTGFTLVELLIVIIIIGILAGAMLLVAGSGTDKAEATKIVSNLRSMKAAALLYYADNPSETDCPDVLSLDKYMDRKISEQTGYVTVDSQDVWLMGYEGLTDKEGVQEKLSETAKSNGLLGPDYTSDYADGDTKVYMRAR
jgi:general secretion pathway protein G